MFEYYFTIWLFTLYNLNPWHRYAWERAGDLWAFWGVYPRM